MTGLLLFLALQVTPDSIVTETRTSVPMRAIPEAEASVIEINLETDSIVAAMREWMADDAIRQAFAQCGCVSSGPPDVFWYGTLAVATLGILVWSRKDVSQTVINNTNEQAQEQTMRTVVRRGWWKRSKKHGR